MENLGFFFWVFFSGFGARVVVGVAEEGFLAPKLEGDYDSIEWLWKVTFDLEFFLITFNLPVN